MNKKALLITMMLSSIPTFASAKNTCDKYDCQGLAESIIREDSRSWFFNRYDKGSAKLVKSSVWESPSGLKMKFRVNYTYNNGSKGWAELELRDGEFYCIRYHDFPNTCRTEKKF
ncbi:MAG: hypothetical protein Q4A60_07645 [Pasteurellaceae bacterium]|nr:hypothetical protein [Pasteurellaceae bacterium]